MNKTLTGLARIALATSVLAGLTVFAAAGPAAADQPVWYDEVHCGITVPNFLNYKYDQPGVAGVLGCPTGGWYFNNGPDAGRHVGMRQNFEHGWITYDAHDSVSYVLAGPIGQEWADTGFEGGSLGYPISDQYQLNGGYGATFQNGRIYWSSGGGAHAVLNGPITDTWSAAGWENGIGYPTSDASGSPLTQTFQRGKIVMLGSGGAAAVPYALHDSASRAYPGYPSSSTEVNNTFNPVSNPDGDYFASTNHGSPSVVAQVGAYGTADTSNQSPYCYVNVESFDGNQLIAHGGTYTVGDYAGQIGDYELIRLNTASHRWGFYTADANHGGGESIDQNRQSVMAVLVSWCQGKTVKVLG